MSSSVLNGPKTPQPWRTLQSCNVGSIDETVESYLDLLNDPFYKLSDKQKTEKVFKLPAKQIFSIRAFLKEVLERHEATISQRWARKTKQQRAEILQKCWQSDEQDSGQAGLFPSHTSSKLPETRRSDLQHWFNSDLAQRPMTVADLNLFLCPYFSIEELETPNTMLDILRLRTARHPIRFVKADAASLTCIFRQIIASRLTSLLPCSGKMLFSQGSSPSEYVVFDSFARPAPNSATRITVPIHDAGIVLHAQTVIMKFLQSFVRNILHEMTKSQMTKGPVVPEPSLSATIEISLGFRAEAVAAYTTGVDLDLLINLVTARRDEAIDEFRAMREDPGYYSGRMLEAIDDAKYDDGNYGQYTSERWIKQEILHIFNTIHQWAKMLDQLKEMRRLYNKGKMLTFDELMGMLPFLADLYALIELQIEVINTKRQLPASFQKCMRPKCNPLDHWQDVPIETFQDPALQFDLYVWWLKLWVREYAPEVAHIGMYLQHHMQRHPTLRFTRTPRIQSTMADICLSCVCLQQVTMSVLWNQQDFLCSLKDELLDENMDGRWKVAPKCEFDSPLLTLVKRMGSLKDQRFYYPCHQARSERNMRLMCCAEGNLDAFWNEFNKLFKDAYMGTSMHAEVLAVIQGLRNTRKTPTWQEFRSQVLTESSKPSEIDVLDTSLSDMVFELQYRTEQTVAKDVRPKIGARKKQNENASPCVKSKTIAPAVQPTKAPVELQIAVTRRALKVFHTIFFVESISGTPGQVSWADFLHAMESADFTAQKMQGSAWHFMPKNGSQNNRSIHFHEPHPSHKLEFWTARHFGRRLTRNYGWTSKTFHFAGKAG